MDTPDLPDPLPRAYELGKYVIEAELEATSMGRMYKAWDSALKALVAINVLGVELREKQARWRFLRGVRKASLAGQPVYDYGDWLGVPYVVVGYSEDRGALVDVSNDASEL